MCMRNGMWGSLYQLRSFFQCSFSLFDSRFSRFADELGYLVELLVEFGLDEFELGFVAAEELGAKFWVRHGREVCSKRIVVGSRSCEPRAKVKLPR